MTAISESGTRGLVSRASRGPFAFLLHGHGQGGFPLERDMARDHFVEHDAEGVEIDPGVDLLEVDLLGRHVFRRSQHQAGSGQAVAFGEPGQPEIHDLGLALPVDHHVLGLEVAMDDAEAMGFGQAFGDLPADVDGLGSRQVVGPADEGLEVFALDEFHGQDNGSSRIRPGHTGGKPADGRSGGRTGARF